MGSYILGISGGSASGKTFLLNQLTEHLPESEVTLISLDNYYKELKEQKRDEEGLVNFDHPESIDFEKLVKHVRALIQGKTVELLEYNFNVDDTTTPRKKIVCEPAPLIIIEGLFVFWYPGLERMLDLKVFVDAQEHIKLSRRIIRDRMYRGESLESILKAYEKYVAPMYRQFVEPFKNDCDLIIPNNKHMYKAIQVLKNHLSICIRE